MKHLLPLLAVACLIAALLPGTGMARTGANVAGYSALAGSWYVHGYTLTVSGSSAYAIYRTYTWCSAHRKYGCDKIVGNNIYDGGVWWGQLQHGSGFDASGTIYAGGNSSLLGLAFGLHRQPNDFLLLTIGTGSHMQKLTLCGPSVPAGMRGSCGA